MTVPEEHELTFPDIGCFGCSLTRPDGLRIRFRRRGDLVVSEHAIPGAYHGPPGIAHGGIVDAHYGSGVSFRDPDGIALEFFAPPA